jgi:hypothetical protein
MTTTVTLKPVSIGFEDPNLPGGTELKVPRRSAGGDPA